MTRKLPKSSGCVQNDKWSFQILILKFVRIVQTLFLPYFLHFQVCLHMFQQAALVFLAKYMKGKEKETSCGSRLFPHYYTVTMLLLNLTNYIACTDKIFNGDLIIFLLLKFCPLKIFMPQLTVFYVSIPHGSELSLFHEQLDCNFAFLWVQPSIEGPVVYSCFEPTDCLLRPISPIHRRHLRGRKYTQNTMN